MKKFLLLLAMLTSFTNIAVASLVDENVIQSRVDSVGTNLLNKNRIQKRIVFTYDKKTQKKLISVDKTLTKRQIILYDGLYQSVQSDDELAAMLAREIYIAVKSYSGMCDGLIGSIQVALGSKKFEIVADKRAVDYMVNADYNPIALIVFINKI